VLAVQLQARQQLDDTGLQELELMLEEAAVMGLGPGGDAGEPRINYDLFTQVRGSVKVMGGSCCRLFAIGELECDDEAQGIKRLQLSIQAAAATSLLSMQVQCKALHCWRHALC
jgi:hypothetical protein